MAPGAWIEKLESITITRGATIMAMDTRDSGARREKTAREYASDVWQGFLQAPTSDKIFAGVMIVVAVAAALLPVKRYPEE